MSSVKYLFF